MIDTGVTQTYTYDPTLIGAYGLDKMRFQLGDTAVLDREFGCVLCDEEYLALLPPLPITAHSWLASKCTLVEGILHKLAYQVDTKIDVLEYDLSSRINYWQTLYLQLLDELAKTESNVSVPYRSRTSYAPPSFCCGIHDHSRPTFRGWGR